MCIRDSDSRAGQGQPRGEPWNSALDSNDPDTTNLYVGNMSPNITEEYLYREFCPYGAIQSVKIMWPRTEEERQRARHCGFVAFVNRDDAAKAKDAMNEKEIMGYVLRVGWGKAVAKPAPALTLAAIQARTQQAANAIAAGGTAIPPPGAAAARAARLLSLIHISEPTRPY